MTFPRVVKEWECLAEHLSKQDIFRACLLSNLTTDKLCLDVINSRRDIIQISLTKGKKISRIVKFTSVRGDTYVSYALRWRLQSSGYLSRPFVLYQSVSTWRNIYCFIFSTVLLKLTHVSYTSIHSEGYLYAGYGEMVRVGLLISIVICL